MSQALKEGDAVNVNRPGRTMHQWKGRIVEPATDGLVWVAFHLKTRFTTPDAWDCRNKSRCELRAMPLSQLNLTIPEA